MLDADDDEPDLATREKRLAAATAFPELDAFTPEAESDRSTAEHGESDGIQPPDL